MPIQSLLKVLLQRRHLQTHAAFTAEYEKTARQIDRDLIGTAPGREQLQRWLSARVKTAPRPHHCRVLEQMFPGYDAVALLAPYLPEDEHPPAPSDAPSAHGVARSHPSTRPLDTSPTDSSAPATAAATATGAATGAATGTATGTAATDPPTAAETPSSAAAGTGAHGVRIGSASVGPVAVPMLWQGADLLQQALDRGSVGEARLRQLAGEADRLGIEVVRVPPATLLEHTLLQLRTVYCLVSERQPVAAARELARTGSKLAAVIAEILWNENQLRPARQWYDAARRAALEAGDRALADIALGGGTYIPAYTEHPRAVLANVDPRLSTAAACAPASPAIAWLWAFKARAHAALGESSAFEHAVHASRQALDRAPDSQVHPGIFSFRPEKLAFYEAYGRVELGDGPGAFDAAEVALAGYDHTETTEPTLVRLQQAGAVAQGGDLPEACDLATRALLDPAAYHSLSVVLQARAFDRRLGPTTRATAEWRQFLEGIRPPNAAALAPSV